jgi:hypothetical protein
MLTVKTANVFPPIPIRQFDWVAWFDGMEEGPQEHGTTEAEAVSRLWAGQGRTSDGKSCLHCGCPADVVAGCAVGGCPLGNDL